MKLKTLTQERYHQTRAESKPTHQSINPALLVMNTGLLAMKVKNLKNLIGRRLLRTKLLRLTWTQVCFRFTP